MEYIPCSQRTFPYRLDLLRLHEIYLRWLARLAERLGAGRARSLWEAAFPGQADSLLEAILSSGWREVPAETGEPFEKHLEALLDECLSSTGAEIPRDEARRLVEATPPIPSIRQAFPVLPMEKDLGAYEALHLRFDGQARLTETLIAGYGKQGELIAYDMMVESRLRMSRGESGSVEAFLDDFTSTPETPSLFTAGLETRLLHRAPGEAVLEVLECEWARYFRQRHPQVGYLMACSTDEVAYRAFHPSLRMQRTHTLMEGAKTCDFRIFTAGEPAETDPGMKNPAERSGTAGLTRL